MPILSLLLFAQFAFTSPASPVAPFEVFLYGEKPGFADPFALPAGKSIRLHLVRDGFTSIIIRFPAEAPQLVQLKEVQLRDAKFLGEPTIVNAYALGVQSLEKSSAQAGPPPQPEVADIVVPNEWLTADFRIPEKRVPARAQYLFEFHAPEKARPGDYDVKLHFVRNGQSFDLPLQFRIHKLKLPKQLKLKTSFGFAPYGALVKHFGKWTDRELDVHDTYARIASEHRIDLHKYFIKAPLASELKNSANDPLRSGDRISFMRLWEKVRSPQLNPYGFTFSTTDLPVPLEEKEQPTEAYWKALEKSVIEHDLLDKSFVYFSDEPEAKTFPKLSENLKMIRAWAPQLTFLVTSTAKPALDGVNLWCPNLLQWNEPGYARPEEYRTRLENKNERFWLYTSCMAHGCNQPLESNSPDLVMDRPSAFHRAFPWAAFEAKAEGILYYNTVEAYGASEMSPWRDPFLFTGYGEGNLFYPCTQRFCGTNLLRALPSLRLKVLRDGLEDVEILEAGERAGLPVREWAKAAYRGVRDFSKKTAEFERVKVRVLEALDGAAKTSSEKENK